MYELNTCHNITISYFNEYLHTRQEHQPSILGGGLMFLSWSGSISYFKQQLMKINHQLVALLFSDCTFSSNVHDLCVTLDSSLTFTELVFKPIHSCNYQLRLFR